MNDKIYRFIKINCRRRCWFVFVAVVFAILNTSLALCPGAAATPPPKQISKNKAISLARQITGYPKAKIASAKLRQVDGSVFPFGRPKKRLVWEIALKVTIISGDEQEGYVPNPFISGLQVLLEANTGLLVRIQSVPFDAKNLKKVAGRMPERQLRNMMVTVIGLSPSPSPSLKLISFAEMMKESFPSVNPKATAITAYLVTISNPPHSGLLTKDIYWVILVGGFHAHVFSYAPDKAATESMGAAPAIRRETSWGTWGMGIFLPNPAQPEP